MEGTVQGTVGHIRGGHTPWGGTVWTSGGHILQGWEGTYQGVRRTQYGGQEGTQYGVRKAHTRRSGGHTLWDWEVTRQGAVKTWRQ